MHEYLSATIIRASPLVGASIEWLQQPGVTFRDICVTERAQGAQAEVGEQLAADEEDASEPDSDADEGSGKKRKRRKKLKSHLRAETRKKTSGTFFRDLL